MSLFTQTYIPDCYFVCMINSRLISFYVDNFINNTSHFQINDARQLPIIIPTSEQLEKSKFLYNKAVKLKQSVFNNIVKESDIEYELSEIEIKLNEFVETLYYLV